MFLSNTESHNQFINTNTTNNIFQSNVPFAPINSLSGTGENITNKLDQVWTAVNTEINDFLQLPDWDVKTRLAITGDWSETEAKDFFSNISPSQTPLEILPANNMPGIAGGYDAITGKIYLSEDLVKYSEPAKIAQVLIEEIGHKADDILNPGQDSPGDEGEILAKLVSNQGSIPRDWRVLKQEDDHKFIQVGNIWIGVETSSVIPKISIPSITLQEGDVPGQTNANFTASLDQKTDQTVSFTYSTTDDLAAKSGSDFTAKQGSINFLPGETSKTIAIPIVSDELVENDERFLVKFSEAINGRLSNIQATATITNDDLPNISVEDVTIQEGNSGLKNANFKVNLDKTSPNSVTLKYHTLAGGADTTDIQPQTGTIEFAPRSETQIVSIPIIGDTAWEIDETFSIQLSDAVNGVITKSQGMATIKNDDFPKISIDDSSIVEGHAGETNAQFKVKLDQPIGQDLTLTYKTTGISAVANTDFIAKTEQIKFAAGTTEHIVNIPVIGNTLVEKDKKFVVKLSDANIGKIVDSEAVGIITNDDIPNISIEDFSIVEGNQGEKNAKFSVNLDQKSYQKVTVKYKTTPLTASDQDFRVLENQIEFLPGIQKQFVNVPIKGDTLWETDEQFFVELSDAVNATIIKPQGVGTITNDDFPNISIEDSSVLEGGVGETNAQFKVKLDQPIGQDLTLTYNTTGISAVANTDFIAKTEQIKFAAGTTEHIINIPVIGNTLVEKDKKFVVKLSDANIGKIVDSQGVGIITNDDFPNISVEDVTIQEGNSGQKNANFKVTLDQGSLQPVTFKYQTVDGTANTTDFKPQTGTIEFPRRSKTQTVSIPIIGDGDWEPNETFSIKLSDANNGIILKEQGIATILNDDMPAISIEDVTIQEGNSGQKNANFKVTLDQISGESISVQYQANGLNAVNGNDFIAKIGEINFLPGEKEQIVAIPIIGDKDFESDEKFSVSLSQPTNAKISRTKAIGTITNDDQKPILTNISINDNINIVEGNSGRKNAAFVVELDQVSDQVVTVKYETMELTAKAGEDFVTKKGQIKFSPGKKTQTINIPIKGDRLLENDEKFIVRLSDAKNSQITKAEGQGIIISDDYTPISEKEPDNNFMKRNIPTFTNLIPQDISVSGKIGYTSSGKRDTDDYYRLVLNKSNKEYNVVITLQGLSDDAQLAIYEQDGTLINSPGEKGTEPEIIRELLPNGTYYVRVYPKGGANTDYTLSMKRLIG